MEVVLYLNLAHVIIGCIKVIFKIKSDRGFVQAKTE